jgi:xanthine dehydrogenase accessory factor
MKRLPYDGDIICVRGAGDLATGVIQKLARAGARVLALEIENPTAIRRHVALSSCIQEAGKIMQVEDIIARYVKQDRIAIEACWAAGEIPVVSDPYGNLIKEWKPVCVVDAILAKRNVGTTKEMAPITIGMGPGFCALEDVDCVIETMRGNSLGRLIMEGSAIPNTGVPGEIGGKSQDRVIHAAASGSVIHRSKIGQYLKKGEPILEVGSCIMTAPFDGVIRGLIVEGMEVLKGMKIADIDPRVLDRDIIFSISDKARCLGGAVLEAYLYFKRLKGITGTPVLKREE